MKKQIKKQQSGRSMIEMVGVLAVMGLITAGAFVLIGSASSSQKRNRVIDDVMEIASGMRSLYAVVEEFPAKSNMPAVSTLLNSMNKSSVGPYSGSAYSVERASGTTFTVSLTKVPNGDCSALKIKEWKGKAADPTCTVDSGDSSVSTFAITFTK